MSDITPFAYTNYRNIKRKFGIKEDDRRRHIYIVGKTGMGKSVLIENMIYSDIMKGKGACLVDPHGDSAELIVDCIPSHRINDVVYFNPADLEHPFAFNVLEKIDPKYRHLVASGLVGVFKKIWADSWGPRLEYILRNTILALLDYPDSTLLGVNRMLVDKEYRRKVIAKVTDPVVKMFWEEEFAKYNDKFVTEAIAPIQNKIGQFLSTSLIRNIVGQVKSSIDLRDIMDNKKILILNLSKGRIGEDAAALLGAMMITKIQLAAMSRVDIPEEDRNDFYLYIDEFQNFSTESFANILSEARKYRLSLIMAHQYLEQLSDAVKAAVFGNVGTMLTFRVGAADAEELVKEFSPTFTEEDILNLPKFEMYLKLMIDGLASDPFSARGLPPLADSERTGNLDKVIKVSRERYARPKEIVEEKIERWHESNMEEEAPQKKNTSSKGQAQKSSNTNKPNIKNDSQSSSAPSTNKNKYTAQCSRCGAETQINFKPDGVRPVYCRDCLAVLKEEKNKEAEERRKAKEKELQKISREENGKIESESAHKSPEKTKQEKPQKNSNSKNADNSQSAQEISLGDIDRVKPINFKKGEEE